jgi:hypothetical protein
LRNKKNNILIFDATTADRFIFWVARDALLALIVGLADARQDHSPKSHLKIEIGHQLRRANAALFSAICIFNLVQNVIHREVLMPYQS